MVTSNSLLVSSTKLGCFLHQAPPPPPPLRPQNPINLRCLPSSLSLPIGAVKSKFCLKASLNHNAQIPTSVAHELSRAGHKYLDVRTSEEFGAGHAPGAVNVPYMFKDGSGMSKNPNFVAQVLSHFRKDDEIIVGCHQGKRSTMAATDLVASGFTGITVAADNDQEGNSYNDDGEEQSDLSLMVIPRLPDSTLTPGLTPELIPHFTDEFWKEYWGCRRYEAFERVRALEEKEMQKRYYKKIDRVEEKLVKEWKGMKELCSEIM